MSIQPPKAQLFEEVKWQGKTKPVVGILYDHRLTGPPNRETGEQPPPGLYFYFILMDERIGPEKIPEHDLFPGVIPQTGPAIAGNGDPDPPFRNTALNVGQPNPPAPDPPPDSEPDPDEE